MLPVLILRCAQPGLLYVNGAFCGEMSQPLPIPIHPDVRVYVEYHALDAAAFPLAVPVNIQDGQIQPTLPSSAYALQWPDQLIELELRPITLPDVPIGSETLATLAYGNKTLVHRRAGDEETLCLEEAPLLTLPTGARDLRAQPIADSGLLVLASHNNGQSAWLLTDGGQRPPVLAEHMDGVEISLESDGSLRVVHAAGDAVGHAWHATYSVENGRFAEQTRKTAWLPGAPRWPQSPRDTLRAYLEALRMNATGEAAAYLAAGTTPLTLPACDAVIELPWPPMDLPGDCPVTLGLLERAAHNLGRVRACCARAVPARHPQGEYLLDRVSVLA